MINEKYADYAWEQTAALLAIGLSLRLYPPGGRMGEDGL